MLAAYGTMEPWNHGTMEPGVTVLEVGLDHQMVSAPHAPQHTQQVGCKCRVMPCLRKPGSDQQSTSLVCLFLFLFPPSF